MREEELGRTENLSEIHKNIIRKLIADSSFNISNRIALKLKNNYEEEVQRSTIFRFLLKRVKNGKDRRLFSETMDSTKKICLNSVSK